MIVDVKDLKINLAAVRVNANMNQREWADALNLDLSTITKYEKGITEPSASTLRKMSELSHIPMDCIFVQKES